MYNRFKINDIVVEKIGRINKSYKIVGINGSRLILKTSVTDDIIFLDSSQVELLNPIIKLEKTKEWAKKCKDIMENISYETKLSYQEAVWIYQYLTRSCDDGIFEFLEENDFDKDGFYSVKELLEITKGKFNNKILEEKIGNIIDDKK